MKAFTVVGRNYLAHARTLADSLRITNPGIEFHVLVLDHDGSTALAGESFHVLTPADVFTSEEFGSLVSIYSVMELATAVKPRVLMHLLESSDGPVFYLDPDLWFFGSLSEVGELASRHGIVLTPHATTPIPRDDLRPAETEILRSGVYNLGFIAVGQSAKPFLEWWWDRLRRDCIVDPHNGVFVDQRWVDFVPGLFDHFILDESSYNVAYWNLAERDLVWDGNRYLVDGAALRFIHFSGFNPLKPHLLSKHTLPNPRVLISERPALKRIATEYAEAMLANGYDNARRLSFALDVLSNGVTLDRFMRAAYRTAIVAFEDPTVDDVEEPPNPVMEPDAFLEWLNEPAGAPFAGRISRYMASLWLNRVDVQSAFGIHEKAGVEAFFEWVIRAGQSEESIPRKLMPQVRQTPRSSTAKADSIGQGINVAGYLRAELGVGEAARTMAETVEAAGEPLAMLAYAGTESRQAHAIEGVLEAGEDVPPFDINIVTINADSMPSFAHDVGSDFFDGRYTIGMWAWEVEDFPVQWLPAFDFVDEVWMNSQYAADALASVATKPVFAMPLSVSVPDSEPLPKSVFGLPDRFMFLFSFDFFSVFERKNPVALVEAFASAFSPGDGPILFIKSINGDKHIEHLELLRSVASEHPDIYLYDGYLPADQKNRLMATCDAYVSLHRSEGFGITMAEAMALGKPTIATAYSGNLEFMASENSYLVDVVDATVPPGCDPYPVGARWSDPVISHAAELMRYVYEHPDEAGLVAEEGRRTIELEHSPRARAATVRDHVERIRSSKGTWGKRSRKADRMGTGAPTQLVAAAASVNTPIDNRWFEEAGRGPTSIVRSSALAMLRPALARERAIDEEIVDALFALWNHIGHSARQLAAIEQRLDLGDRRSRDNAIMLERAHRDSKDLTGRIEDLKSDVGARATEDERFRDNASNHLARLSEDMQDLQEARSSIDGMLHARPYMADPTVLHDASGFLGFTDGHVGDPYREFEDIFRGDEAFIRERQRAYLPLIDGNDPVLDAGCGRGEFLDLLASEGIPVTGVDLDAGMVARCAAKGHQVVHGDVIDYLANSEETFGSVFSAQFIEHIPVEGLIEFMRLAVARLRPGGLFVAETVNPHSFPAFRTFWTDLTHRAPIFPEVALAYARSVGFAEGRILFPNGTGDPSLDLRQQGEYALVAYAPS